VPEVDGLAGVLRVVATQALDRSVYELAARSCELDVVAEPDEDEGKGGAKLEDAFNELALGKAWFDGPAAGKGCVERTGGIAGRARRGLGKPEGLAAEEGLPAGLELELAN
jgi:hypothetical protein